MIYVLMGAAALALALDELSDVAFIAAVLLVNAIIGFVNERRAEREVRALLQLVRAGHEWYETGTHWTSMGRTLYRAIC